MKNAKSTWRRSFYLSAIAWRFLLTPVGTIRREYPIGSDRTISYLDVYIFGIRLARIHV